jgi:HEAT repeat protein
MQHVFISYIHEDQEQVQRLYDGLSRYGIKVWIDHSDIALGVQWKQAIRRAIQDGAFFIACFSKQYISKSRTYMNEELTLAIEELRLRSTDQSWFLPVKLSECEIPDRDIGAGKTLRDIQHIGLYEDWNSGLQKLLSVVSPIADVGQKVIQLLRSQEPEGYEAAIEEISRIGDDEAVSILIEALSDESGYVRSLAASALGDFDDARILGALISALNDPEELVRTSAANALGQTADLRAISGATYSLVEALSDESEEVRHSSAQALEHIGELATDYLMSALMDDERDEDARALMAKVLARIGSPRAIAVLMDVLVLNSLTPDKEIPHYLAKALREIDDTEAVRAMAESLNDEDPDVRFRAALGLGYIGSSMAVPALIEALGDEDSNVGSAAVEALGRMNDPTALHALIEVLRNNDDDYLRRCAAEALGRIDRSDAIPALIEALGDEHMFVRSSAASSLGSIGEPAVAALIEALGDEDGNVHDSAVDALIEVGKTAVLDLMKALESDVSGLRRGAAKALGEIGDLDAVPGLLRAGSYDEDADVRRSAHTALDEIGSAAAPQLIDMLSDHDSDVRRGAAERLGQIGDAEAVPSLIQVLKDETDDVRREAVAALRNIGDVRAVPALVEALDDESYIVRRYATEALGDFGDVGAVPALMEAFRNEDYPYYTAVALGKIGGTEVMAFLVKALRDGNRLAISGLAASGAKAVSALREMLSDEEPKVVREDAAEALGEIADATAISALVEALHSGNEETRAIAVETLHGIRSNQARKALKEYEEQDR